jgi:hypothetical protein
LKKFKGLDVTLDPVGQILASGGTRKSVGAGAERGYEERGRLGFATVAIVDGNGVASPVHEHFLAGAVFLA